MADHYDNDVKRRVVARERITVTQKDEYGNFESTNWEDIWDRGYVSQWDEQRVPGFLERGEWYVVQVREHGRTPYFELSRVPQVTNGSHEEREVGWLGMTNNVDRYAIGKRRARYVKGGVALNPVKQTGQ